MPKLRGTGRVESYSVRSRQTEEGMKLETRVVLRLANISNGSLDDVAGMDAQIDIKTHQAAFGEQADPPD